MTPLRKAWSPRLAAAVVAVALVGCGPRYVEPPALEAHGHLAIFNLSRGGRLIAYHLSDGRSRRIVAFHGPGAYRYVRIAVGASALRFEVEVGGVRFETRTFDVSGDPERLTAVGVDGPRTTFHEIGGPRGHELIERVRSGSPLRWEDLD